MILIISKSLSNEAIIATIKNTVKNLRKKEAETIHAEKSLTFQNSNSLKDNLTKNECKALK